MGVTGIEGLYRCSMESCLSLMRSNKDTLLSIIEPFLRDPTVNWSRSGRAQRTDTNTTATVANSTRPNAPNAQGLYDRENSEAKDMLLKISGRLNGIYNITHPAAERIKRECISKGRAVPNRGLGASKDEELPMSVQGQVQRLIDEATMLENLCQMFMGWQAWL